MTNDPVADGHHGASQQPAASSPAATPSRFPAPRFVWLATIAPRLWTEWSMWRINRWIRTLSDAELARLIRETRAYITSRQCGS